MSFTGRRTRPLGGIDLLFISPTEIPPAGTPVRPELAMSLPTLSRAVELKDGQKLEGLLVVLDPGGVVSGIVRDAKTGAPVANASVDLFDRGVNTVLFGQYYKPAPFGVTDDQTTTDEAGRFEF